MVFLNEGLPSGQITKKKNNLKEYVYVNSALKIQYHTVKNTLLQTAFSAILPAGLDFSIVINENSTALKSNN